jgi:hypothetical protein
MRIAFLLLLVSLLVSGGCASLGNFAVTDLKNAAQVASQTGDTPGAVCRAALTPVAQADETAPGLASRIEADRPCDPRAERAL